MILEPGLVAAKPALDLGGGLFEAGIRFVRPALGVQVDPRAQTRKVQSERYPDPSRVITTWPPTEPGK